MKRFAIALAAVGALALFTVNTAGAGDAAASKNKAAAVNNDVHVHYQVLYYRGHHWYLYATYRYHSEADRVAHHLDEHGYHTTVRAI